MTNQYPPTHAQYVASHRHHAANMGAALGMVAAIGMIALGVVSLPATYISLFVAPLVLFAGAAIGMATMAVAGSLYASATYSQRYRNEFARAREMTQTLAEDPDLPPVPAPERVAEPGLLVPPEPPAPSRSWTALFHRHESQGDRVLQEQMDASGTMRGV